MNSGWPTRIRQRWPWLAYGLVASLTFACYARTIGYGWVWDDLQIFADPAVFSSWSSIRAWMFAPFLGYESYFRPLALASLALNERQGGGAPGLFHATNVGLHVFNTLLVCLLAASTLHACARASRARIVACAALAGLLYGIHPALIEGVSWISARFDLLTATFGLLALCADRCAKSLLVRAVLGPIFFLCAALCKEMILGLLLLLPFWHWANMPSPISFFSALRRREHYLVYLAYVIAGLLYLVLRVQSIPAVLDAGMIAAPQDVTGRFLLIGKTLARYFELALWPFSRISPIHYLAQDPLPTDIEAWVGWALVAATIFAVWLSKARARMLALYIACFWIALLPVSQLARLSIGDSFAAERFLQFPMVFVALMAAHGAAIAVAAGRRAVWLAAAVSALWLFMAVLAQLLVVPAWRSEDTLWSYAYSRAPQSRVTTANLLSCLIDRGEWDRARAFAETLRERQGGSLHANQQIAYAYLLSVQGEHEQALNYVRAAGGMDYSTDFTAELSLRNTWGQIALNAGALDEALDQFERIIVLAPQSADAYYYSGLALEALGKTPEALAHYERAYTLAPASAAQWRAGRDVNVSVAKSKAAAYRRSKAGSE